jgi:hypothetical protein
VASLQIPAEEAGKFVRGHWDVENSVYWVFDMVFHNDESRVRTDHAPADFNTIKHLTLNLLRIALGKDSFRLRRNVTTWDYDFLVKLQQHEIFTRLPWARSLS